MNYFGQLLEVWGDKTRRQLHPVDAGSPFAADSAVRQLTGDTK
jgi:hypothetical protein